MFCGGFWTVEPNAGPRKALGLRQLTFETDFVRFDKERNGFVVGSKRKETEKCWKKRNETEIMPKSIGRNGDPPTPLAVERDRANTFAPSNIAAALGAHSEVF